jgi:hypothetical protein
MGTERSRVRRRSRSRLHQPDQPHEQKGPLRLVSTVRIEDGSDELGAAASGATASSAAHPGEPTGATVPTSPAADRSSPARSRPSSAGSAAAVPPVPAVPNLPAAAAPNDGAVQRRHGPGAPGVLWSAVGADGAPSSRCADARVSVGARAGRAGRQLVGEVCVRDSPSNPEGSLPSRCALRRSPKFHEASGAATRSSGRAAPMR